MNSVEIRRRQNVHYGWVEFGMTESHADVLSKELLRIGGCDFQVKAPNALRYPGDDPMSECCRTLSYYESQWKITEPAIGYAADFNQLDQQDTTVYLTNYNIPIRTLYIAPVKVDVSIPFCIVL